MLCPHDDHRYFDCSYIILYCGRMFCAMENTSNRGYCSMQFDVTQYQPKFVLENFWKKLDEEGRRGDAIASHIKEKLRIVVAGGDGTVAWVLGTISDLKLDPAPAVAVMPLGTGNDLSINLGWGSKFESTSIKRKNMYDTLLQYSDAVVQRIDFWNMRATAPDASFFSNLPHSVQKGDGEKASTVTSRFWNYFSVGLDAEAAYGFHSLREVHPSLTSSRLINQAWYSFFSCKTGWFCGAKPIEKFVSLAIKTHPEGEYRELPVPSSIRALVLLNVQTFGGGRDVWGVENSKNLQKKGFKEPRYNDGLIEIVGLKSGWHSAMVMGEINSKSLHAKRLGQCCAVRMKFKVSGRGILRDGSKIPSRRLYMELDGEPWEQHVPCHPSPSDAHLEKDTPSLQVEFEHGGVSRMLANVDHPIKRDKKIDFIIHQSLRDSD